MNIETMTVEQIREYVEYYNTIRNDRQALYRWNLTPAQELAVQHYFDVDEIQCQKFSEKHHPYC